MRAILALLLVLALPALPTLADPGSSISPVLLAVHLAAGAPPSLEGPAGFAAVVEDSPGGRLRVTFEAPPEGVLATVRSEGYFEVSRPAQIFPQLFDDHPGHEAGHLLLPVTYDPAEALEVKRIVHLSGTGLDATLRILVPGPGPVALTLERDVTPPQVALGPIENLTHVSFLQTSRTDEAAFGNLRIREVADAEWIENPTQLPAPLQIYPVQGLDPEREYEAFVTVQDWSANENATEVYRIATPKAPVLPPVRIRAVTPAPNATLGDGRVEVRVDFESASLVEAEGVRLFFDLREVTSGIVVRATEAGGNVTYNLPALATGLHRVSVEIVNALGGAGEVQWSFVVARGVPGFPEALGLLLAGLAARGRASPLRGF